MPRHAGETIAACLLINQIDKTCPHGRTPLLTAPISRLICFKTISSARQYGFVGRSRLLQGWRILGAARAGTTVSGAALRQIRRYGGAERQRRKSAAVGLADGARFCDRPISANPSLAHLPAQCRRRLKRKPRAGASGTFFCLSVLRTPAQQRRATEKVSHLHRIRTRRIGITSADVQQDCRYSPLLRK